jgi:hypothetical protein
MKRVAFSILVAVLAIGLAVAPLLAADYDSPSNVSDPGPNRLFWTGQGAYGGNGTLENVQCEGEGGEGDDCYVAPGDGYLLWVFTTDGGSASVAEGEAPQLTLEGVGTYDYCQKNSQNSNFHFVTPYVKPDKATLTAYVTFYTSDYGGGQWVLTISHGCPGEIPPPPQAHLYIDKFYDADADGVKDPGEPFLNWLFTIDDREYGTPFDEMVSPGTYLMTELMPCEPNWVASGITVLGTEDYTIISETQVEVTLAEDDDVTILFGNYCLKPSGGKTIGFWSNKNGQAAINDGGTADPELAMLSGLNLTKANGGDFDPTSYWQFRTWLLSATATNMAYMLSAQLAAMALNVEAGFVDSDAFYIPYGGTISQLMAEANAELGLHGAAYDGDAWRGYQETLKNYLDALNNGDSVIPSTPCAYSFTCGE